MPDQSISRSDFLKVAGLSLAGVAVTCSGLGVVATRKPGIELPELILEKESTMNRHVLVTYATRAGSTGEIAAAIGATLAGRGFRVELQPVKSNPQPGDYDAVILGSPIRMGKWLGEMVQFVEANQSILREKPVALFTVHMLNTGEDAESRAAREGYLEGVRALLPEAEAVYFEGAMDFSRLSLLDRFISRVVKAEEADQRDWDAIRAWAETLFEGGA